jgi:hypothetical protein
MSTTAKKSDKNPQSIFLPGTKRPFPPNRHQTNNIHLAGTSSDRMQEFS